MFPLADDSVVLEIVVDSHRLHRCSARAHGVDELLMSEIIGHGGVELVLVLDLLRAGLTVVVL